MTSILNCKSRDELERWHTHQSFLAYEALDRALAIADARPLDVPARNVANAARAWRDALWKLWPAAWPATFAAEHTSGLRVSANAIIVARLGYDDAANAWLEAITADQPIREGGVHVNPE